MSKRESQPPEASGEECRRDAPVGIPDQDTTSARGKAAKRNPFHQLPSSNTFMLRLTVLAARPLGKSATATLRPVGRNFSSFGSKATTNAASSRSRVSPSSFWSKCSRTFMTDSAAVTTRPTQSEAWKKYAVTAVGLLSCSRRGPRSAHKVLLGYRCWDDRRHQCVFEP